MIQYATCTNESLVISELMKLWPNQEQFNQHYTKYQQAARAHSCKQYQSKFKKEKTIFNFE